MMPSPEDIEGVQDIIQDKLQKANVEEPIQDKLGQFALKVIENDRYAAKKVYT